VRFSHFRTRDQHEVDLIAQTDEGTIAGLEVKASSTVADTDLRGLRLLQDSLGADFLGGVVLNLGQRAYTYEDRLHVASAGPPLGLTHAPGTMARSREPVAMPGLSRRPGAAGPGAILTSQREIASDYLKL
jgi:hypothetical protein